MSRVIVISKVQRCWASFLLGRLSETAIFGGGEKLWLKENVDV
jgi:hypothetical protein